MTIMNKVFCIMNKGKDNNTKKANTHSSLFSIHNSILGFTLPELLVVISLMGILVAISFSSFSQSRKSARDVKRKADLEQIRSALEIYRSDCKTYPAEIEFGGSLVGDEDDCGNTNDYMTEIPADPLSPTYQYFYTGSINSYALCAYLETGGAAVSGCGTCDTCNYKVVNP